MVNVTSNVKLSSSGNIPTTGTLQKGYMAFGSFGGKNKLYGNVGSDVVDLIGDAKTVLYFASQSELNEFLQGSDVPVGEWYAAVAEKTYEQYGEWAAYKIGPVTMQQSASAYVNDILLTQLGSSPGASGFYTTSASTIVPSGTVVDFVNYAHTRYYLYLDFDHTPTQSYQWVASMRFNQVNNPSGYYDIIVVGPSAVDGVPGSDMENVTALDANHFEGNMQNYTSATAVGGEENAHLHLMGTRYSSAASVTLSGYLVMKEILSDGEPWIDWEEIKAMEANNG